MSAARSAFRLRLIAGALCALAALPVAMAAGVGAMAHVPRSCVVPMPCCERGFCPLHAHGGSHHGDGNGPRWVRCDDDTPLLRLSSAGPLAVLAPGLAAALPRLTRTAFSTEPVAPPSRAAEPELHPPQAPLAS